MIRLQKVTLVLPHTVARIAHRNTLCCLFVGIDAHAGIDIVKNVAIALAICYTVLATFVLIINCIHTKGRLCGRDCC